MQWITPFDGLGNLMIWMIGGSLIAALAGLGLYIYYWRKGHFDDDEMVKYQIFREDQPDD